MRVLFLIDMPLILLYSLILSLLFEHQDKKGLGQNVCHDCTISYLCVDKHYLFTGECS